MMTVEAATEIVEKAGYKVIYTYVQPDTDWFDEYYNPLEQKLAQLSADANEEMKDAIDNTTQEIKVRREHGDEFGHVAFVLSLDLQVS